MVSQNNVNCNCNRIHVPEAMERSEKWLPNCEIPLDLRVTDVLYKNYNTFQILFINVIKQD